MEEKMSTARVKKLSGAFTFRVENYSGLSTRVGDSTESPEFDLCDHTWQLRIFPGGSLDVHRGHVSFYLASKSTRSARASYKLLVINQGAGADETFASSGIRTFEARGVQVDGWGRDKFMTMLTLQDPSQQFIVDDTVIFKVEITVFGDLESTGFPVVASLWASSSTCLTKNLHTMLQTASPETADLLLIVGPARKKIWCHRCMLAARSSVFHAMLIKTVSDATVEGWTRQAMTEEAETWEGSSDSNNSASSGNSVGAGGGAQQPRAAGSHQPSLTMISSRPPAGVLACLRHSPGHDFDFFSERHCGGGSEDEESKLANPAEADDSDQPFVFLESHTGVVVIPDFTEAVAREFLCYIYTDALSDVTVLSEMSIPLLIISSKYQVPSLFSFVEEFLCLRLTVDNAIEMLGIADTFSALRLKELAMKTVIKHALVLTVTNEYKKNLHPSLIDEVEKGLQELTMGGNGPGGCVPTSGGRGEGGDGMTRRVSQCVCM